MKAASPAHFPTCAECDVRFKQHAQEMTRKLKLLNDNPLHIPLLMRHFRYGKVIRLEVIKGKHGL